MHVDLDTGMRRTGLAASEVVAVVEQLVKAHVAVTGVMTHLASADEPDLDDFTLDQLAQFEEGSRLVADLVAAAGGGRVIRHALKNAFLPVLSYLGPAAAYAMTGSFVVEQVFDVPGLGQHFVNAVRNKDLFIIMGVTLIYSSLLILFNLVVDVMYRWVDPRIDFERR